MRNYLLAAIVLVGFLPAVAMAAININTADATLLDTLPGIGPAKAAAIIEYRTTHGPFSSTAEIQEVKGIGPSTYANIEALITVSDGVSAVAPKAVQPATPPSSYEKEQSADSAVTNITEDDHALKPAAAQIPAAAAAADAPPSVTSALTSSWTMVFLVLLVVAGGALLVL